MTDEVDAPTAALGALRDGLGQALGEFLSEVRSPTEFAYGVSATIAAAVGAVRFATGLEGELLAAYMQGQLDGVLEVSGGESKTPERMN